MVYRLQHWIKKWFKKEPFRASISCLVFCAHLFVFVQIFSTEQAIKTPHKQIVVKTIAPKSAKQTEPIAARPHPPKPPAAKPLVKTPEPLPEVKQEVKPAPKKETLPVKTPPIADKKISKTAPKKPEPSPKKDVKPKETSAPTKPAISKELLQELESSIAKIEGKREQWKDKRASSVLINPSKMDRFDPPSAIDTSRDYQSILIQYLHDSLNLPDYGEVKVQLTLHSDGSVAKWQVLKTESDKNRKYLESRLSALKFPPPEKGLGISSKTQHTFVLTFCNE